MCLSKWGGRLAERAPPSDRDPPAPPAPPAPETFAAKGGCPHLRSTLLEDCAHGFFSSEMGASAAGTAASESVGSGAEKCGVMGLNTGFGGAHDPQVAQRNRRWAVQSLSPARGWSLAMPNQVHSSLAALADFAEQGGALDRDEGAEGVGERLDGPQLDGGQLGRDQLGRGQPDKDRLDRERLDRERLDKAIAHRPPVDALVTDRPGILLGIITADCAPVLFADKRAGVVAAAHAGWRGAHGGVLEAAIHLMQQKGARLEHIAACIGPCIAQDNYEVDAGFRDQFLGAQSSREGAATTQTGQTAQNEQYFQPGRPGHFHFDLSGYVENRLVEAGLRPQNIEALRRDTYDKANNYYSYRRAQHSGTADYGRQISLVGLK